MPYLVLNLDDTIMCSRRDSIHRAHAVLSTPFYTQKSYAGGLDWCVQTHLYLINPEELSLLIRTAIKEHQCSGIIFLTTGTWSTTIILHLANQLFSCPIERATFLAKAEYFSPIKEVSYWERDPTQYKTILQKLASMDKGQRLERIIQHQEPLKKAHFIVIDNDMTQIESFSKVGDHVEAIHATIATESKDFYRAAREAFKYACDKEKKAVVLDIPIHRRIQAMSHLSPTPIVTTQPPKRPSFFDPSESVASYEARLYRWANTLSRKETLSPAARKAVHFCVPEEHVSKLQNPASLERLKPGVNGTK